MTVSTDRVTPSTKPDSWRLFDIFVQAFVLGFYLTLSSVVYFYLVAHTNFFTNLVGVHDIAYNVTYPSDKSSFQLCGTWGVALKLTNPKPRHHVFAGIHHWAVGHLLHSSEVCEITKTTYLTKETDNSSSKVVLPTFWWEPSSWLSWWRRWLRFTLIGHSRNCMESVGTGLVLLLLFLSIDYWLIALLSKAWRGFGRWFGTFPWTCQRWLRIFCWKEVSRLIDSYSDLYLMIDC